jgi:hypothetical protein
MTGCDQRIRKAPTIAIGVFRRPVVSTKDKRIDQPPEFGRNRPVILPRVPEVPLKSLPICRHCGSRDLPRPLYVNIGIRLEDVAEYECRVFRGEYRGSYLV